jgi:hypothetical protein
MATVGRTRHATDPQQATSHEGRSSRFASLRYRGANEECAPHNDPEAEVPSAR